MNGESLCWALWLHGKSIQQFALHQFALLSWAKIFNFLHTTINHFTKYQSYQMGILFSSLWSKLFSKAEVKIIIVGLDNAGKTTILYKLFVFCSICCLISPNIDWSAYIVSLLNEVVTTTPTIGSNVEEITYKNIKFLMWASTFFVDRKSKSCEHPTLIGLTGYWRPRIITNFLENVLCQY